MDPAPASPSGPPLWTPVLASLGAGAGTAIGGLIVFLLNEAPGDDAICFALSFAAGVMSVVSVTDLLGPSLLSGLGPALFASLFAALGMAVVHLLSFVTVPEPEELATSMFFLRAGKGKVDGEGVVDLAGASAQGGAREDGLPGGGAATSAAGAAAALKRKSTWRLGILLCGILSAHNLPEGVAVGVGVEKSAELGLAVALAIFLHNVAEGVVVAIPLLAATRDRTFAVLMTAASGLTEPLGALLGVLLLRLVWGDGDTGQGSEGGTTTSSSGAALTTALDAVLCAVGGVMLKVSASELIPQAVRAAGGKKEPVVAGFIAGGVVIGATSLLLGG